MYVFFPSVNLMSSDYTCSHFFANFFGEVGATWGKHRQDLLRPGRPLPGEHFTRRHTRTTCADSSTEDSQEFPSKGASRQQLRIYSLNFRWPGLVVWEFLGGLKDEGRNLSFRPIKWGISAAIKTISATKNIQWCGPLSHGLFMAYLASHRPFWPYIYSRHLLMNFILFNFIRCRPALLKLLYFPTEWNETSQKKKKLKHDSQLCWCLFFIRPAFRCWDGHLYCRHTHSPSTIYRTLATGHYPPDEVPSCSSPLKSPEKRCWHLKWLRLVC